jgi:Uri superfamily endonuclease
LPEQLNLPDAPGTYVLFLRLDNSATLHIGRLGVFSLAGERYAYVGSARGPGGLRARVSRHLRHEKIAHWHIDALTAVAPAVEVWWRVSPERLECTWARALAALPGVTLPVPGFGASDCACRAHLFAVPGAAIPTAWAALGQPARFRTMGGVL